MIILQSCHGGCLVVRLFGNLSAIINSFLFTPVKCHLFPSSQYIFSIIEVNQIKCYRWPLKTATGGEERNSSGAAKKDYEQAVEQTKYDL